jgi:hypothetical protein
MMPFQYCLESFPHNLHLNLALILAKTLLYSAYLIHLSKGAASATAANKPTLLPNLSN